MSNIGILPKGGLLTSTGTTNVVLPAGSNTTILIADSAQPDGVKWAAPAPPAGTITQFDVLVGGAASAIASVGPGSAGQYLQSGGNAANPAYSTATLPSTATGTGKVLIADGTNWVASTPTFPNASATSGKFIQSDGTNWIASTPALPVAAGTSGNVLTSDGTNWTSAAPSGGSATAVSTGMTTNQSIAQNALVDVVYDTVIVDTASGFSAGAYTIPTTGNWQFSISAVFKSTAGFTNCDIFLRRNGATFLLHGQPCVSVSDPLAVTVNAGGLFALTSGDVITISVFAQTIGATNYDCLGLGNGYYNTFAGVLIA